ncbi:putative nitrate transporter component, NrtA [Stutzerimonas xanthomarina]|nr:putative nitrate transporter component, NrtA [Stutzerimonas xanthomarina]
MKHEDNQFHGSRCPCGAHSSMEEHRQELGDAMPVGAYQGEEKQIDRAVETTVLRSLFPDPILRRQFLKAVGASTALAAISQVFPLGVAQALAKETAPLEKTSLDVGFVPITCTIPLLLAQATGEYAKEGLNVNLIRTPGWSVARDNLVSGEYDASHMVLAMPLTMSLGVGSPKVPTLTSLVQNINGDALALHIKHRDKRNNPSSWKGFRFGIPHDHSVHAMLLRYYLAEHGLDPDKDVELRVYPPPDSVANMAADNLDGMFFAEPWNQRAVFEGIAFLQTLSVDIFPNHPCCVLSVTDQFVTEHPNTYGALFRSVARAGAYADAFENRQEVAELMAPREYLNQPMSVLQQVLLGRYADGLGNIVERKDRIGFKSFPYDSTAIWLMTQLKRWNIIAADVDMTALATEVFRSTDAARRMQDIGLETPANSMNSHIIMGKKFDPNQPEAYLNSFDIRRT